jgi:pimeloyl-ACP methyl ester carboxylesterase
MNTKDSQLQTRRFIHSATRWVCLFAAMLTLCGLAASEALGQGACIEAYKNCSACGADTFQGSKLIGVSTSNEGKCVVTGPSGCKPTDPCASENLKACQKCLEGVRTGGATEEKKRLPIIFLPGVAGTQLYNNSAAARAAGQDRYAKQVWPLAPQALDGITRYTLRLREDGKTPADNTKLGDIIVGDILRRSGIELSRAGMNFYGGMMKFIEDKGLGYKERPQQSGEKRNLFAFPYDWRLDNATHFTNLDKVIDYALEQNPNAKKVILLAHSMGGVIARAYILSKPEWAAKVDSLITMGTPYWGAPKPYYAVVSGYNFDNDSVDREVMKILAQNFPAAYQLMPNYPFIEDGTNKRILTSDESNSIRYKGMSDVTPPKQIVGSYKETPGNDWFFNNDPGFVKLIQDFNDPRKIGTTVSPEPLPAGVKHYVIIGVGVKTLERYSMRDFRPPERFVELAGRQVVLEPIFGDGDGTVPCEGAEISTATSTYYIPYVTNWAFDDSSGHSELPANKTVQEIVGEIIDGKPPDPSKYKVPCKRTTLFTRDTAPGLKDLDKGTDFTLHSDAHLSIADQSTGRKLGFNNQGGIDEDLPSGTFLAMEGIEYASIADINRTLRVTVTGIREGKFTLDVNVKRAGGTVARFSYVEVPVKPGTAAEFTMTPGQVSAPPPLTVTTDGRTTTIPASSSAGGPVIPQGGAGGTPQSAPVSPLPSSSGIAGTWTAPTGDIIELIQNGNRITGRYRGILGTGEITGTFDGENLSATVRPNQALLPLAIPLTLTLMEDGKLFGRLETPLTSGALVFSRTRR